jgi:hypothetical protein
MPKSTSPIDFSKAANCPTCAAGHNNQCSCSFDCGHLRCKGSSNTTAPQSKMTSKEYWATLAGTIRSVHVISENGDLDVN